MWTYLRNLAWDFHVHYMASTHIPLVAHNSQCKNSQLTYFIAGLYSLTLHFLVIKPTFPIQVILQDRWVHLAVFSLFYLIKLEWSVSFLISLLHSVPKVFTLQGFYFFYTILITSMCKKVFTLLNSPRIRLSLSFLLPLHFFMALGNFFKLILFI